MKNHFDRVQERQAQLWAQYFPGHITKEDVKQALTQDLPFDCSVTTEFKSPGRYLFSVEGKIGLNTVFKADDLLVYPKPENFQPFIGLDEVRLCPDKIYPELKGKGIGKVFADNMISLAKELNLSLIRLKAGRANGPIFWARHGFNVERMAPSENFWKTKRNYNEIASKLDQQTRDHIESVFEQALKDQQAGRGSDANRQLAELKQEIEGRPLCEILYKGVEYGSSLELENPDQLSAYNHSMRYIQQIRKNLRSLAPTLNPTGQPGLQMP